MLLKRVFFRSHLVLLQLNLLQLVPLCLVRALVSLLLLSDHLLHLDPLIHKLINVCIDAVQLALYVIRLALIVTNLGGVVLKGGAEEELSIADAAAATHATLLLEFTQRQICHRLDACELVGENSKLVSALFTRLVPTKLTTVLMSALQLLVAHIAENKVIARCSDRFSWILLAKDRIYQLKADLLGPYMNLVRIAHQITLYLTLLHAGSATHHFNCASTCALAGQH